MTDTPLAIPLPKGRTRSELTHYTGQAGLEGITRTRELWATDIQFLNDSAEFTFAKFLAASVVKTRMDEARTDVARKRLVDIFMFVQSFESVPATHVFSLSENGDDLGQWRGYSRDARGYGLVFDGRVLKKSLRSTRVHLVRCAYKRREQLKLVGEALDAVLSRPAPPMDATPDHPARLADGLTFSLLTSAMAPALKSDAFQAECEWRLVTFPGTDDQLEADVRVGLAGLVPYVRIRLGEHFSKALRSVTVGPMPDQEREKLAVERLLASRGLSHVSVNLSRVPFRTW